MTDKSKMIKVETAFAKSQTRVINFMGLSIRHGISAEISYLIEIAVTVECMADLHESCLASVIIHCNIHWK